MKSKFTAIVRQEEGSYVALTPELDIASQGSSRDEAVANLREAIELFLESASREEVEGRLSSEAWITQLEIEDAKT